jgi:hypothetical protein
MTTRDRKIQDVLALAAQAAGHGDVMVLVPALRRLSPRQVVEVVELTRSGDFLPRGGLSGATYGQIANAVVHGVHACREKNPRKKKDGIEALSPAQREAMARQLSGRSVRVLEGEVAYIESAIKAVLSRGGGPSHIKNMVAMKAVVVRALEIKSGGSPRRENTDEDRRVLERAARQGDKQAAHRLAHEWVRSGLVPVGSVVLSGSDSFYGGGREYVVLSVSPSPYGVGVRVAPLSPTTQEKSKATRLRRTEGYRGLPGTIDGGLGVGPHGFVPTGRVVAVPSAEKPTKAYVLRGGQVVHPKCYDETTKSIEERNRWPLPDKMLTTWPRGAQCPMCQRRKNPADDQVSWDAPWVAMGVPDPEYGTPGLTKTPTRNFLYHGETREDATRSAWGRNTVPDDYWGKINGAYYWFLYRLTPSGYVDAVPGQRSRFKNPRRKKNAATGEWPAGYSRLPLDPSPMDGYQGPFGCELCGADVYLGQRGAVYRDDYGYVPSCEHCAIKHRLPAKGFPIGVLRRQSGGGFFVEQTKNPRAPRPRDFTCRACRGLFLRTGRKASYFRKGVDDLCHDCERQIAVARTLKATLGRTPRRAPGDPTGRFPVEPGPDLSRFVNPLTARETLAVVHEGEHSRHPGVRRALGKVALELGPSAGLAAADHQIVLARKADLGNRAEALARSRNPLTNREAAQILRDARAMGARAVETAAGGDLVEAAWQIGNARARAVDAWSYAHDERYQKAASAMGRRFMGIEAADVWGRLPKKNPHETKAAKAARLDAAQELWLVRAAFERFGSHNWTPESSVAIGGKPTFRAWVNGRTVWANSRGVIVGGVGQVHGKDVFEAVKYLGPDFGTPEFVEWAKARRHAEWLEDPVVGYDSKGRPTRQRKPNPSSWKQCRMCRQVIGAAGPTSRGVTLCARCKRRCPLCGLDTINGRCPECCTCPEPGMEGGRPSDYEAPCRACEALGRVRSKNPRAGNPSLQDRAAFQAAELIDTEGGNHEKAYRWLQKQLAKPGWARNRAFHELVLQAIEQDAGRKFSNPRRSNFFPLVPAIATGVVGGTAWETVKMVARSGDPRRMKNEGPAFGPAESAAYSRVAGALARGGRGAVRPAAMLRRAGLLRDWELRRFPPAELAQIATERLLGRRGNPLGVALAEGLAAGVGVGVASAAIHRLSNRAARRENHPGAFIFAIGNPSALELAAEIERGGQRGLRAAMKCVRAGLLREGELRRHKTDVLARLVRERSRGSNPPGPRRQNDAGGSYKIKLPADRVLGTMPLGEAARRWPDVAVQVAAFRDMNRGAEPSGKVILWDDRRKDVQCRYVFGKNREMVYGGIGGSPPGSFKNSGGVEGGPEEGTTWVHDSPDQYWTGHAELVRGKPITRDFGSIGSTIVKDGWMREPGE